MYCRCVSGKEKGSLYSMVRLMKSAGSWSQGEDSQVMFFSSSFSNFVDFLIFPDAYYDYQHFGFGSNEFVYNTNSFATKLDFKHICEIGPLLMTERFSVPAFTLRKGIGFDFFNRFINRNLLVS